MTNSKPNDFPVLVTGAGGAAAIAFLKAASNLDGVQLHMADMSPLSSGLYMVSPERRGLLPGGKDKHFSEYILDYCRARNIRAVVPTVDCELLPLAQRADEFTWHGIQVLTSPAAALGLCADKLRLMQHLAGQPGIAWTARVDAGFTPDIHTYPFVVKPREGSGSRGVRLIRTPSELASVPDDGSHLAQAWLPGEEYSVDVYAGPDGHIVASVIRERMKVDSGIAVISRTVRDETIAALAADIVRAVGIRYVANVQFKRDAEGRPQLLEINPRFPGTMSLTVAAGVNMPALLLHEAMGEPLPERLDYSRIAMVRNWQESFMPVNELLQSAA